MTAWRERKNKRTREGDERKSIDHGMVRVQNTVHSVYRSCIDPAKSIMTGCHWCEQLVSKVASVKIDCKQFYQRGRKKWQTKINTVFSNHC